MLSGSTVARVHQLGASNLANLHRFASSDELPRRQTSPCLHSRGYSLPAASLVSTFFEKTFDRNRESIRVGKGERPAAAKVPARLSARAFFPGSKKGKMADGSGTTPPQSKVVVVTGASKGLGRALVLELARRGHKVAGCGRDATLMDDLGRLLDKTGPTAAAAAAGAAATPARNVMSVVDVASDDKVKAFAQQVISTLGVPDIVVNCAGVINANNRLWEVPREEMDLVLDVNVKGTVNVIRHFAPGIVERRQGVFVNFSSGWGRSAAAEVGPYCASKWAVEGLTKSLAHELPAGCVAVALNPGVINTAMLQSCFGSSAAMYPTPEEWAPRCASLILGFKPSDNGASLTV